MTSGTQYSLCNPNKCKINCCKNDFECADNVWECRVQQIGSICYENHECKSSCCDSKVCKDASECSFSEFKAISFVVILVVSALILIIFCVYCRRKRKTRQEHVRRGRVPRLRDVIAEGELIDEQGPPINMVAITLGRSVSDLSNQSDDLQRMHLTKPDPISALNDTSEIVWRRRASGKVLNPIPKSHPQSLDDFDPFSNTRASTWRYPVEEAAEVHPSTVFELHLHQCENQQDSDDKEDKDEKEKK